ncbi:MAG: hypothetical protein ATN35_02430 [Epulopiscium sp. Nele67-Bin004]|nr:MAG: hypothetical protein ATN35_02430 [Epulopiscium sp. Nele67-Bin004]
MEMNERQREAITTPLGPTLVVAGPGSGKTTVIVERINHLITEEYCKENNILVITFTKASAKEMEERYKDKYGVSKVTFGTFHSVFYRILRQYDRIKYDLNNLISEEKKKYIISNMHKATKDDTEDFVELFLSDITLMKNQLISLEHYNPSGIPKEVFETVYTHYESYKQQHSLFDFDDMLVDCYDVLKTNEDVRASCENRYKHILIDEFQDINIVQFETIKLLKQQTNDIFVVGDDDQSIYSFRGAKPEILLDFPKFFEGAKKVVLDTNYRSIPKIIEVSNELIMNNKNRVGKVMKPSKAGEVEPKLVRCNDDRHQATVILERIREYINKDFDYANIAVIYRTNIQARHLVEALLRYNIPFNIRDGMSALYSHWMTKDILAYLKLADDLKSVEQFERIANKPSRYITKEIIRKHLSLPELLKDKTLTKWQREPLDILKNHLTRIKDKNLKDAIRYIQKVVDYEGYLKEYAKYRNIPFTNIQDSVDELIDSAEGFETYQEWEANLKDVAENVKHVQNKQATNAVTLTTMHGAKGLEFDIVFLIDIIEDIMPHKKSSTDLQIEEERRLLYVAITRAKQHLYIYTPKSKYTKSVEESPFIKEMNLFEH